MREQRVARFLKRQSVSWGTTSSMYFHAVELVFRKSQKATAGDFTKSSRWVYAGVPVLIAGVEAFFIEHQNLLKDNSGTKTLAGIKPLADMLKLYPLTDELRLDMEALIEVRNQIVHPAPLHLWKTRVAEITAKTARPSSGRRQHSAKRNRRVGFTGESSPI